MILRPFASAVGTIRPNPPIRRPPHRPLSFRPILCVPQTCCLGDVGFLMSPRVKSIQPILPCKSGYHDPLGYPHSVTLTSPISPCITRWEKGWVILPGVYP